MEVIRWLLAGVFFLGTLLSCTVAIKGFTSGKIGSPAKHSSRAYTREEHPDKFWRSVTYFAAIAAFATYLGYETITFTLE